MTSLLDFLDELIHYFELKTAYEIFDIIGSPKYILAPMILQSDLPFRMQCRKHGATLCYTPMITSSQLIRDYQEYGNITKHIISCTKDRPLVVQLCSNNVLDLTKAALIIQNNIECDAIDINLGCPQSRAEREVFGAFLLTHPNVVYSMIRCLVMHCILPVFVKMRLLSTFEETLQFVKMLENAGVSLIAIHGRGIRDKNNGSADLDMIRRIKDKCDKIPIVSNGNVRSFKDVEYALKYTKCDGVMSAEGIRVNPYLFEGYNGDCMDICWEYLEFVEQYGVIDTGSVNKHILYFCKEYLIDLDYEYSVKCQYKRKQIGLIRKLLRWPKICHSMIQYHAILDLLERIIEKKPFKHPDTKIFSIEKIKKQPGYIKYWHKHHKKSNREINNILQDT